MKKETTPKTVLESILHWSKSKPAWQRDALRRIVADGTPADEDVTKLVALCKQGQGDESVTETAVPLEASHLPVDPDAGESISLVSISDVEGVNQLAPNNTVTFQPTGLNIVYGQNGTGKSGYARILKRACRARQAGKIMADAFNPSASGKANATITIHSTGSGQQPIDWEDDDQPHPVLSAVTVFDRDSGAVHLRQKNEVWFRPFGLDIPDDLAAVCQQVKEALSAEKAQLEDARDPLFDDPIWSATSPVGKFLNSLTADSNLDTIKDVAILAEEDQARLTQLQRDLSLDPQQVAAEQRQRATKVEQMLGALKAIQSRYTDETIQSLKDKRDLAVTAREAADLAAQHAFGGLGLDGVGAPVWRSLWDSARLYSEALSPETQNFPPQEGEICVLCHQQVDAHTAARMKGFEEFIQDDTEKNAKQAEDVFKASLDEFERNQVDIRLISEARSVVREQDGELAREILKFVASARLRRWQVLAEFSSNQGGELKPLATLPEDKIEALGAAIRAYAEELAGTADPARRQQLVEELEALKDRQELERLKNLADTEIKRLRTIRRLEACISETATNSVTKLGNDIADTLITPKMRDRFAEEIGRLAAGRIRVEVVRSGGRFGSPQYEVQFFANAKAKVGSVLSEGEQTCVALASYLTELANASHKSALVFDDPVSSLDHRWRRKVAERLVAESRERQIVVFTHDLIFVNDLHEMAAQAGTMGQMGSLSRSGQGVGVYADGLPWRAAKVRERIDKLEKNAREAKALFDNNEDESYHNKVVSIYGELRAAWERGLEDVVFAGVLMRHRDYINTKNLKKVVVLEDADVEAFGQGFQKCCDFTEAHDPSRGRDEEVPPPEDVLADIQALADWEKALRTKQNSKT